MPKVDVLNMQGSKVGEAELSENIFAVEMNEAVVHQVVKAQLAAPARPSGPTAAWCSRPSPGIIPSPSPAR